jgi:integrase
MIKVNPALRLRLPMPERREGIALTSDDVHALARAMPREQDRIAIYLAAIIGPRAGELWALAPPRREPLEGDRPCLAVAVERARPPGVQVCQDRPQPPRHPDAAVPDRHAPRPPGDPAADPETLLFTSPGGGYGRADGEGGPIRHGKYVSRYFRPAVKAALDEDRHRLRWHDLRHTAVTFAWESGEHPARDRQAVRPLDRLHDHGRVRPRLDAVEPARRRPPTGPVRAALYGSGGRRRDALRPAEDG